jgi:Flp pilus assembly secretin CpaC
VPYLRRVPLVGYFFQDRDSSERYTETVIYVTPRLNDGRSFDAATEEIAVEQKFQELEERHRKGKRR